MVAYTFTGYHITDVIDQFFSLVDAYKGTYCCKIEDLVPWNPSAPPCDKLQEVNFNVCIDPRAIMDIING